MKSGVYHILNVKNNKRYIGSSQNIDKRFNVHKKALIKNLHYNKHLQSAFNKYGEDVFIFEPIEYCTKDLIIEREQFYIDLFGMSVLYNLRPTAGGNKGFKYSEESKQKMREKKIGKTTWNKGLNYTMAKWSDERKKKTVPWSKGLTGIIYKTPSGPQNKFEIVSPEMILYRGVSLKSFIKSMGFTDKLYSVTSKQADYYKGWRLPRENDIYMDIINYTKTN